MSRMGKLMMATLMMAAASGMAPGLCDIGIGENPWKDESDEDRKRRMHKLNPIDTSQREFVIKGERIIAHDKKTALKIYANHHPEAKGKKRKKK